MGSDRRDYSESSSFSTKRRLIAFPTISPNRPSQNCRTTNNIAALSQRMTEPVTRVYVGLFTAWSSDYHGHRLNALADFSLGSCVLPADKNLDLERTRADGGGPRVCTRQKEWLQLLTTQSERSLNFMEHKREER